MMRLKISLLPLTLLVMLLPGVVRPAVPVAFTIDPSRSQISLSGSVTLDDLTYSFAAQGTGSLTDSYLGTVLLELAPPYVSFPGGSAVVAATNGSWQPAPGGASGSAAANYGGKITPPLTTGYSAGRNLRFDVSSSALLLTNGAFDISSVITTFLTNSSARPSMDFRVTSLLSSMDTNGSTLLVGSSTNGAGTGYLTNAAGVLTLILPVNAANTASSGGDTTTMQLQGQIVATAPETAWPLQAAISSQAGQITLSWYGVPGQTFRVDTCSALGTAWTPASGNLNTNSQPLTFSAAAPSAASFYRVVSLH